MSPKHSNFERLRNIESGKVGVKNRPLFAALYLRVKFNTNFNNLCPPQGWAVVTNDGQIHLNANRMATPGIWSYIICHCLLHLGFGHFEIYEQEHPEGLREREWQLACDYFIQKFLCEIGLHWHPDEQDNFVYNTRNEEKLYNILCEQGLAEGVRIFGAAGEDACDMLVAPLIARQEPLPDWKLLLAKGLSQTVAEIVEDVAPRYHLTEAEQAREWFINCYPLLSSLAAGFKMVEDAEICRRMDISIAAVSAENRTIYINPYAGLSKEEYRFVLAHELLHVGLRHEARQQGRDAFLWNVACDYVINGWLVEMAVGNIPQCGLLYDPTLKGESAEAIYDVIVKDMRRMRKLQTFRGSGLGDILDSAHPEWWKSGRGVNLDDFYRSALNQGLSLHQSMGRGLLPGDMIEDIRAQAAPPPGWEVELARWFDAHFLPLERKRSYARLSRRQSATPDIPRPRYVIDEIAQQGRTFGVVLDTSGSMDSILLAKALGAIASYSIAHEVVAVRVIFCDAVTYDQGFMQPEAIAGHVKVRGRGGTILQPGINLLEEAEDFPKDGPILIITDGFCDNLRIRREHAFMLPVGNALPFTAVGPIFRIE